MPNGSPLNVHFFAVAENVTALGATGAGRVKVIVTGLKDLSRNVPSTVVTLDAELFLKQSVISVLLISNSIHTW